MIRRLSRPSVVTLLLVAALHGASAQTLTGTVTNSLTHQPIRGAVVLALDGTGTTVSRTLSNGLGAYQLTLSASTQRIRVLHIGFRPRTLPLVYDGGRIAPLHVELTPLPAMLEPVHATANAQCPSRNGQAEALALWEQAREGLLATVVARDVDPPRVKRLHFNRSMDGGSERIVSQSVVADSLDTTTRPFTAARSGADFTRFGFRDRDGETFFAPDADVLLDPAFADAYCFSLAAAKPDRPHEVGLAFSAPRQVKDRTDIEGTLWIDTLARRLSDIEFQYVGFRRSIESLHPGGRIAFREMPNGSVLIDRWHLRLVGAHEDTSVAQTVTLGELRPSPQRSTTIFVQEVGGELASATRRDGTEWHAQLGTIRAVPTRSSGPVPAGVRVTLAHTTYATVTDSSGAFEIRDLLPGPYRMDVSDADLAAAGFVEDSTHTFVAARDSVIGGRIAVATLDEYLAGVCELPFVAARHANALLGHVLTSGGAPAANILVKFETAPPIQGTRYLPHGFSNNSYLTGTDGAFWFCYARFAGTVGVFTIDRGAPDHIDRQTNLNTRLVLMNLWLHARK